MQCRQHHGYRCHEQSGQQEIGKLPYIPLTQLPARVPSVVGAPQICPCPTCQKHNLKVRSSQALITPGQPLPTQAGGRSSTRATEAPSGRGVREYSSGVLFVSSTPEGILWGVPRSVWHCSCLWSTLKTEFCDRRRWATRADTIRATVATIYPGTADIRQPSRPHSVSPRFSP